jgi:hypothetical protein
MDKPAKIICKRPRPGRTKEWESRKRKKPEQMLWLENG